MTTLKKFASFFKNYSESLGVYHRLGDEPLQNFVTRLQTAWLEESMIRSRRTFLRFSSTAHPSKVEVVMKDLQMNGINLIQDKNKSNQGCFWAHTGSISTLKQLKRKNQRIFYLQSFSSAIPVNCLSADIQTALSKGNQVAIADFCAAPGSKTIQLIEQLSLSSANSASSLVYASEMNSIRFKHLQQYMKESISDQDRLFLKLARRDASIPLKKHKDYFDFILLDVPCSGEGLISASCLKSFNGWNLKIVARNVKLQRRLIDAAVWQLKPGGMMIYSTCTLNPYENEEQVAYLLEKYPFMQLESIPENLLFNHAVSNEDSPFSPGMSFGTFNLEKCLRIFPSPLYEGFFIAKLRKTQL